MQRIIKNYIFVRSRLYYYIFTINYFGVHEIIMQKDLVMNFQQGKLVCTNRQVVYKIIPTAHSPLPCSLL